MCQYWKITQLGNDIEDNQISKSKQSSSKLQKRRMQHEGDTSIWLPRESRNNKKSERRRSRWLLVHRTTLLGYKPPAITFEWNLISLFQGISKWSPEYQPSAFFLVGSNEPEIHHSDKIWPRKGCFRLEINLLPRFVFADQAQIYCVCACLYSTWRKSSQVSL